MREIWEGAQGVAVDWMFSFRIKFVGLESILGDMSVVAGAGLFLTFWRSLGRSLGEQVVFMTACFQQTSKKVVKHARQRQYPIPWNEKYRYCLF